MIKAVVVSATLVASVAYTSAATGTSTPGQPATATQVTVVPAVRAAQPRVPSVVGKSKANAIRVLKRRGYVVRTKTKKVTRGSSGRVLSQKPKARTRLAPGSRVVLTISKRAASKPASSSCTPGYSPCLPPASDYDCADGSGNGPKYVYGTVEVTGSDPYDLDRDGDGYGCD